jgi:dihydroxy-acid dehydratase
MILGGSTNAVLHLIAIAHSVGVPLTIDDFQAVAERTPFLADLKPSGKYVFEDVYKIGGIPSSSFIFVIKTHRLTLRAEILAYLMKHNLINGNIMTVTGATLGENLDRWTQKYGELSETQDVIRPLHKPIKETGHLRYAYCRLCHQWA